VDKATLIAKNKALTGELNEAKLLLQQKELIIAKLSKMIFGVKSERYTASEVHAAQISLFAELEAVELKERQLAAQAKSESETKTISYQREKASPKKYPNRQPLPDHLPRVEIVIEPEGDLDGLKKLEPEVTEILDIIPPKFQVIRIIRNKYADPAAQKGEVYKAIRIAPMPDRVIDRGIPSTRLLAYIMMNKFVYHLPYYRQIQMFKQIGVIVKANTINGWIAKTCVLLEPLYQAFCKHQFSKSYLQADETTLKVLQIKKTGKKGKAHTGYYWVYLDPIDKQVVFIFNPGRGQVYPAQHLKNFKGNLQTDGLKVYDAFDKLPCIILLGCMAHIRRKFIEAVANDKKNAEPIVLLIQQLYKIEDFARKNNYTHQQRYELRQEKAVPIMAKLKAALEILNLDPNILKSNAIGEAVRYALGRWKYQERYLHDGKLEIDNNLVENAIRPVAIGRKNWLFGGSEEGAKWGAIINTLLGSAMRQNLDPLEYLTDVLRRLPDTKITELGQLFPINWTKKPDHKLDLI
jgi:transposase